MAYIDKISELMSTEAQSPTEDSKLAHLKNTMVPRRLDGFDSITRDLTNIEKSGSMDRVNMYANFKLDEFHGRSYKVSMPELTDYISNKTFKEKFGTDNSLRLDELKEGFQLGVITGDDITGSTRGTLDNEFDKLELEDSALEIKIEQLDSEKMDKFLILGDGDYVSEGEVKPYTYIDEANKSQPIPGVHATTDEKGNVTVSHADIIGAGAGQVAEGWTAAYTCGGVAKNRHFTSSTSIREIVRLMLYGDPQYNNIIYYGALSSIPDTVEELLQLMAPSGVDYEDLLKPGYTWDLAVDMAGKFPAVLMPEAMYEVPELISNGHATVSGNDIIYNITGETIVDGALRMNLECDGVWLDRPWVDPTSNEFFSDKAVDEIYIQKKPFTWTNPEGKLIDFALWYVDELVGDTVSDHASHKWSFRFKE